jgi:hypothetical protein
MSSALDCHDGLALPSQHERFKQPRACNGWHVTGLRALPPCGSLLELQGLLLQYVQQFSKSSFVVWISSGLHAYC